MAAAVGEFSFEAWVAPLELAGVRGGTLVVRAPDEKTSWVRERFLPLLATAAERDGVPVELEQSGRERERAAAETHRQQRRSRRRGRQTP